MKNSIVRRRLKVGDEGQSIWESGTASKGKPAGQLKLARGARGGQNLTCVIGKITRRILEDGIPSSPQEKRTLSITRNAKIRMVEKVISFHSNGDLPFVNDRKFFVQRWVKLREPRPPQDISSGIAKLTGRRNRKSAWIKPARRNAQSGPIRTDFPRTGCRPDPDAPE